jgi:hypothetical protein
MLPTLTASRLKSARACLRLHQYQYELGYRPVQEPEALRFGTLWHRGLEAWWLSVDSLGTESAVEAGIDAMHGGVGAPPDPWDLVKAETLLRGYGARWCEEDLLTLAAEQEFRALLINPTTGAPSRTWMLAGKIDALARDANHRTLIVEHKTSSEDISPGSEYWARLRLDGQISMYYAGARARGFEPAGCLYDVTAKPRIRPLNATPLESRKITKDGRLYANQRDADETPDEYRERLTLDIATGPERYYQRAEIVRLPDEESDYMHDVWQLGRLIRESQLAGRWPRNPDACRSYSHTCAFFPVCTGAAQLTDETLYRRTRINPELAAETAGPISKEETTDAT